MLCLLKSYVFLEPEAPTNSGFTHLRLQSTFSSDHLYDPPIEPDGNLY